MKQYKTRAIELVEQNNKVSEVIDKVTKEFNLTDSRLSIQRNIYNWINNKGLHSECEAVGIDASKVKHYWYKGKHYSINVKGEGDSFNHEEFKTNLINEIKTWSPKFSKIKREKSKDPHCLVFDPADIHWPPKQPWKYYGDQEWITHLRDTGVIRVRPIPEQYVKSYKYHCQGGLPADCRVAVFHGEPKPENVRASWFRW